MEHFFKGPNPVSSMFSGATERADAPEPRLGPAAASLRTEVAAHEAKQRNRIEKRAPRYLQRAQATAPDSRPPWSGFTVTPEIETWPPMTWEEEEIDEEPDADE